MHTTETVHVGTHEREPTQVYFSSSFSFSETSSVKKKVSFLYDDILHLATDFVGQFEIEKKGGQSLREREKKWAVPSPSIYGISPLQKKKRFFGSHGS